MACVLWFRGQETDRPGPPPALLPPVAVGRSETAAPAPVLVAEVEQAAPVTQLDEPVSATESSPATVWPVVTPEYWAALRKSHAGRVSGDVATIVGWAGFGENRDALIRGLPADLPDAERELLTAFLDLPMLGDGSEGPLAFNSLKNDVLKCLLDAENVPHGLGFLLARMSADDRHSDVWRDYAVQFMDKYWQRRSADDAWAEAERQALFDACQNAATRIDKPTAGTALLTLRRIQEHSPGTMDIPLAEMALSVAGNGSACNAARATAIQVCARLQLRDVLPHCRKIAREGAGITLRASAIAALGLLSDNSSAPMLRELTQSPEVRLRLAATGALGRLRASPEGEKGS